VSKRRTPGTGSMFPWKKHDRKTGELKQVGWCAVVDLGVGPNGKRERLTKCATKQSDVRTWLNDTLSKHQTGQLPRSNGLTVGEWMTIWLKSLDKRPRTIEHYEGNIRLHIIPGLGSKKLAKLTATDVERFLAGRRAAGLAPRTVHHIRAVLRNALKKAVRNRLIPFNVAAEADPPNVPREEMRTFDRDQVRKLLVAVKGSPLEALFVLAVGLGMREGELLGLRWSDIDMDRGVVRVARELQWIRVSGSEGQREAALVEPKSRTSLRTLPLSAPAVEALRDHRARWRDHKLALGDRYLNQWNLLFVGAHGEPLYPKSVWREWRRILAIAELPNIRFHDLRHTAGTLMREQGVDVKVIQEMLGHSSVSTTLDVYGHVTPGLRQQAVGAQALILGGA
jgi:integrase